MKKILDADTAQSPEQTRSNIGERLGCGDGERDNRIMEIRHLCPK